MLRPDPHMVHLSLQVSLLMTRAQLRQSSWRLPARWERTTALPTPTLRSCSRTMASTESEYILFLAQYLLLFTQAFLRDVQWGSCVLLNRTTVTFVLFTYRGVILFRPTRLHSKFEDGSVKFAEEKFTSAKIKRFIQDNVWVLHPCSI